MKFKISCHHGTRQITELPKWMDKVLQGIQEAAVEQGLTTGRTYSVFMQRFDSIPTVVIFDPVSKHRVLVRHRVKNSNPTSTVTDQDAARIWLRFEDMDAPASGTISIPQYKPTIEGGGSGHDFDYTEEAGSPIAQQAMALFFHEAMSWSPYPLVKSGKIPCTTRYEAMQDPKTDVAFAGTILDYQLDKKNGTHRIRARATRSGKRPYVDIRLPLSALKGGKIVLGDSLLITKPGHRSVVTDPERFDAYYWIIDESTPVRK